MRLSLSLSLVGTLAVTIIFAQSSSLKNGAQIEAGVLKTAFKKDTFNIVTYGAKSDGIFLNTNAINKAITECSQKGGGVVVIPSGLWLTGPIVVKSNVNLHLQKNSLLQFSDDFNQYPLVEGNWEGVPQMRNQSPISATRAQNIAITGFGIVDGAGDAWRMVKKDKLTETQWKKLISSGRLLSQDKKSWYPSEKSFKGSSTENPGVISANKTAKDYEEVKDFLRPNLVVLSGCDKVLLEGVTFQNSPAWNLHPLMTTNLIVRNVYAKNPWYAQNGDGIDVESCANVLIEGSTFDVGDDGICIKSGRDEAGRKRGMPTRNVIIRDCTVYHAHGGFVIGSEMSGGVKNMYVSNCSFVGTEVGLRFKTSRGRGGIVENIYVSDLNMKDIGGQAILFDMYYAAKDSMPVAGEKREPPKVETLPVTETTPQFKDFYVKNIVCNGSEKAIFIRGSPEMSVKNGVHENMVLKAKKGIDMTEASDIQLTNIQLVTEQTDPVGSIYNSHNIAVDNLIYFTGSRLLFNVSGERSKEIVVSKTDVMKATSKAVFNFGADAGAIVFKP